MSGKGLLSVLVLWGFFLGLTQAAIKTTGPGANWQSILGGLVAGDTLYFQPGTYSYSNYLGVSLNGTASAPITVTGYKNSTRPIFAITANQNIFNLVQGNYVIFDYLEFSGIGGVDGSTEGLRLGSPTSAVSNSVFQNLLIHDTGSSGFTANYGNGLTYDNLTIVHNEVHSTGSGTGECFYLGCSSDACRIANSIIANNYCHNTTKATGGSLGSGIQVKTGSYNNIIQDNVCYQLGSCCVLVYDDYNRGRNQIIGNFLLDGNDNGIQATAGVTIVNNIIVNSKLYGISIQDGNDLETGQTYRNISILQNTIVNSTKGCLSLTGISTTTNWVIANNALYCPGGQAVNSAALSPNLLYNNVYLEGTSIPTGTQAGALINSSSAFSDLVNPVTVNLNVFPTSGGKLPNAGTPSHSWSYDYNGSPRSVSTPTIGAYEYSASGNPYPLNPLAFKSNSTSYTPPTPTTTGTTTTAGGTGTSSSSAGMRNFKAEWLHKLRDEFHIL